MKPQRLTASQSIYIVSLYCLPAVFVFFIILGNYYLRVMEVGEYITQQKNLVKSTYDRVKSSGESKETALNKLMDDEGIKRLIAPSHDGSDDVGNGKRIKQLVEHFASEFVDGQGGKSSGGDDESKGSDGSSTGKGSIPETAPDVIDGVVKIQMRNIWANNATIIVVMSITPFLLLGGRLGFSRRLQMAFLERKVAALSGVWMKLVVALIISYGWLYIINPHGRGASTVMQYLISNNLANTETLPALLRDMSITPIIAAFLGWYLYLLSYFFTKMSSDDVVSSQAYGALLQKFLFAWGVTIVFLSTVNGGGDAKEGGNATIIAFLMGYFPMAAFSVLKDKGLNLLQGDSNKQDRGQLVELPGISRWQILRLEEEGIDSLAALAYGRRENLNEHMPNMALLVNYWTDIARLYTVVGQDGYKSLKSSCHTASEFVLRSDDPAFVEVAAGAGINNTQEIKRILLTTFPELTSHLSPANS